MLQIQILDHPCKILIIGASGSGKTKDTYKPHINCLISKKVHSECIAMILKLLLNTRIISMIFAKIFKNKIQTKNEKF